MSSGNSRVVDAASEFDLRSTIAQDAAHTGEASRESGGRLEASDKCVPRPLPPLPESDATQAKLWISLPGTWGVQRVRGRGKTVYVAANPEPLAIDMNALSYCSLGHPTDATQLAQDILAPAGSSRIVVAFGSPSSGAGPGSRNIRMSPDDGRTWVTSATPSPSEAAGGCVPSALVALPDTATKAGRMFATCGGPTLDVSDDGSLTWRRIVEGGAVPAQGFALNQAANMLWYFAEGATDRVAAYWLAVSQDGPLSREWSAQLLDDWHANGVYSAEADPWKPDTIYVGGEGRLGYAEPRVGGGVNVAVRWDASVTGELSTYVTTISPDPALDGSVVFAGGQQGGGLARVLRSSDHGSDPKEIFLEGRPTGTVRGLVRFESRLLIVVDTAVSLAIYAMDLAVL